jgi:hypothetical protein
MSTARAQSESPRREGLLRVLIVDASPSCRVTFASAESAAEYIERVEVIETTQAELDQHPSDSWDLMITHVHRPGFDTHSLRVQALKEGQLLDAAAASPPRGLLGKLGSIGRLFRRRRLSTFERHEQQVTRTVVLAEIQREIGIALSAIEMGDFDTIGEIALRLKDDGAIYDFAKLSGLGAALYDTVPSRDIRTARNIAQKLMTYMGKTVESFTA